MLDTVTPRAGKERDLVCFSHLRWDFVWQRPQHLMSRFARRGRVFFWEEPVEHDGPPELGLTTHDGVLVVQPRLPRGLGQAETETAQRDLLDRLWQRHRLVDPILWYYTPMALGFTRHRSAAARVYDCMDELSLFQGAPPLLREREAELLRVADLVFTGGQSLFEAKRDAHPSVHCFPSSIDHAHFRRARARLRQPADQALLPAPRLGYFGVIDERLDRELLAELAAGHPEWSIVLVGPVVKVDPAALPRAANLHYLGMKPYAELPGYLAGWDVALMPFALNDATRFISPTKTPEYLAGGKPVVSTAVRDVVRPYGELGLVEIAADAAGFADAVERLLSREAGERAVWQLRADELLARTSWASTQERMAELIVRHLRPRRGASRSAAAPARPVPLAGVANV